MPGVCKALLHADAALLKRIAMKLSGTPSDFSLTVIYILIPLLVIAIAVGLYRLLNRHTPSLLKTLTGR